MTSKLCGGFSSVSFKLDHDNACIRNLFVKQNDGINNTKPCDCTLFVLNVPQFINDKCLEFMYEECGEIERIYLHSKPKNVIDDKIGAISSFSATEPDVAYKIAYIVFKQNSGLKKALKCKELPPIPLKKLNSYIGMKKWSKGYNSNFINPFIVQKEIETYMAEYDEKIEEEKRKAKEMESVEDEEGWITITKHSKKPKIARDEAVSKRIIAKQNRENAKKSLLNFYRCQLRDSKMEHILELRKKFEKDKERIAHMKENRKFKPF